MSYLPDPIIQMAFPDARRKAVKRARRMHRTCEAIGIDPQDLWPYYRIVMTGMQFIPFLKALRGGTFWIDEDAQTLHAKGWSDGGIKAKP